MRAWASIVAVGAVLAGCSDEPGAVRRAASTPAAAPTAEPAPEYTGRCPVTLPNGDVPDDAEGFNHGNGTIAVALWPKGRLPAGILPDGSAWAEILRDGTIHAKLGWWRAVEGFLQIGGERLDAPAPPLHANIGGGYGSSGFQPVGMVFPTAGCWRVVARLGDARLAFVVRVRKVGRPN